MRVLVLALLLTLSAAGTVSAQTPTAPPETQPILDPLLAQPGRCANDGDPLVHHREQRLAMHCLIRVVRRTAKRPQLREHDVLRRSATYKARRIAACRVFTHSPCGDALAVPFEQAQLSRNGDWHIGENLAWGIGADATPRAILAKWLRSPTHRDVLVSGRFSHIGLRRRRLRMQGAPPGSVIWVAHLGRRASR